MGWPAALMVVGFSRQPRTSVMLGRLQINLFTSSFFSYKFYTLRYELGFSATHSNLRRKGNLLPVVWYVHLKATLVPSSKYWARKPSILSYTTTGHKKQQQNTTQSYIILNDPFSILNEKVKSRVASLISESVPPRAQVRRVERQTCPRPGVPTYSGRLPRRVEISSSSNTAQYINDRIRTSRVN